MIRTARSSDSVQRLDPAELLSRFGPLPEERTPVLVVGGGLVGLSTALFLAQHGVRALVVEKHPGTALHPRARGFHPPTVELLAPGGVAEAMQREGVHLRAGHRYGVLVAETLAGPDIAWRVEEPAAQVGPLSPCPVVGLGQDRLEPLILEAARQRGAEVRFEARLLAFAEDADGVLAVVEDRANAKQYRVRADWLVAADGARSPVREALGIGRSGRGLLGHNVSTIVYTDFAKVQRDPPFGFAQITHPEVAGVFVPTDVKDRWIYGTRYDPERVTEADFTEADWIRRIRIAAGVPDLPVRVTGTFTWEAAERVALRMREGRIFLAGDAAHQMPPTGGWGANTGIQDAGNLAWKLAAVLHGHAPAALLDTYDAERRPVAAATAHQATLLALRMMRDPNVSPDDIADDAAVVFGYRYGAAEAIARKLKLGGEPGTRAPHVVVSLDGREVSTRSLFSTHFVLLAGHAAWCDAAAACAASTGLPLHAKRADGWQEAYGVGATGASLVRPDGFVAARWPALVGDPAGAIAEALDRALCR
jgi:putative polyketide hydroxylase